VRDLGESARVAVLTPWYPARARPFMGSFVQAMVAATAPGVDVTVYHGAEWVATMTPEQRAAVDRAQERLLRRALLRSSTVGGAGLVSYPVPLTGGLSWAEIARQHAVSLRAALGGEPIPAPVVHAHVGLPGGWAAVENAAPDARVFVTEHASFVGRLLEQPDSRARYDELLHRCTGLLAVSQAVRAPLVEAFPHHADRIGIIANAVAFGPVRPEPVTELRRWMYAGGLTANKGVAWLLEAFARCREKDPELTLTFVGDGALAADLRARTGELGLAGAVTFTGAVPHERALRLMNEHDLLVHPSRAETFGMTVVEAVAAGTPVLVTRCGGPEETLAGIERAAGELVDVEEGSDAIVDGYWRLRERFPAGLDLARARISLIERYAYPAVAGAHHRLWFPDAEAPAAEADAAEADAAEADAATHTDKADGAEATRAGAQRWRGTRVLFLSAGVGRARVVAAEAAEVVAGGGHVTAIIPSRSSWRAEFVKGVRVAELVRSRFRHAPGAVTWNAMFRAPEAAFRALGRGPLAGPVRRVRGAYWLRLSQLMNRGLPPFRGPAPAADPPSADGRAGRIARDARRMLIHQRLLGGATFDLLVVADPASMPLAELLTERTPTGPVARRLCYSIDVAAASWPVGGPANDARRAPDGSDVPLQDGRLGQPGQALPDATGAGVADPVDRL
jgi:glycogen(starch) synthase